ncbi:META domain-containing protein [Pseudooceanicola atlanticus]|uniref:META domain-containing protein n=1 Tax=Pseudooceanicola atlanticus TaxID=1461694 RepID=UPI000694D58A|nr:META domain-containing protein [Pseudooceanicola atlanticus]
MRMFAIALAFMTSQAAASDWTITSVDGAATTDAPTISFADGGISGSTGCNRFTGQADVAAGKLQLSPALAMTRRACLGAELSTQENRLTTLLQGSVEMQLDPFDDSLTLVGNGVTARLVPGLPQPAISSAAYVSVSGVDATLNIRSAATTSSSVVAHAPLGIILRNEGCEEGSDRTWCQIRFIDASGIEGWAAAEFLSPASAIRRAGAELFDQIGRVDCGTADGATAPCDYGLARETDGSGAILIYLADNRRLLLEFRGTSVMASGSDGASEIATEIGDADVVVTSGTDRVTLPKAVLLGE